jgi:hypothetical protein
MKRIASILAIPVFMFVLVFLNKLWAHSDYAEYENDAFASIWPAFICSVLIGFILAIRLLILQFYKDVEREILITSVQLLLMTGAMIYFFIRGPYNIVGLKF